MIKEVSTKIRLTIKDRVFVLMWDDEKNSPAPCLRCALMEDVCKKEPRYSLLQLCDYLVEEPNTFFIEDKPDEESADAESNPISVIDPYNDAL